ncbi:four-carbon acid sugar kinase family protein [Mucilaginibacter boryungensis]|uniref:Four-carbon acid sugar kinase family protein n=1 Tax=Mucilaginibacter boryungensis TaxID=768480 RepID=A0ABR9XIW2_9SPHI|nr:four-carbon acid sugar kinase family protein [Mucilaginibacter boryungensis]MBE9667308.1 four-carbon acid sugar kinase family protein [Mucilaginibacter boryungensis]
MAKQQYNLLLAYYGDDFTGSTDALEFLSRAGVKTVLFIEPPTTTQLSKYKNLQAIGVAGNTRALPPDEMEQELIPAFSALKDLGASHVHYKVCSTFDSSPAIGSIGRAADVGAKVFKAPFIPLLVAAPPLGRYCLYGNLYARMGIGSQGEIYRLDRHPSMSRHPSTPMNEADLRLHLSKQTQQQIGLMDILSIDQDAAEDKLETLIGSGSEIVLFDALYTEQLLPIAELIDQYADKTQPLFSIGSSGIEMALGQLWEQQGLTQPIIDWPAAGKAKSMLVVSGSCSPVTAKQIEYAVKKGFASVAIDTVALATAADISAMVKQYVAEVTGLMEQGKHVIIHTSLGADDPRIADTHKVFTDKGLTEATIRSKTAQLYGQVLGQIASGVAGQIKLQRLVIAGGDTSSFVARTMGIEAVEMIAPVSPGAPLCRAYAPGTAIDGIEVNFKGGQVGAEDYFVKVKEGK